MSRRGKGGKWLGKDLERPISQPAYLPDFIGSDHITSDMDYQSGEDNDSDIGNNGTTVKTMDVSPPGLPVELSTIVECYHDWGNVDQNVTLSRW